MRVALIGCGQIADAHLAQLQRLKGAEVVAVCDLFEDLAWQAARRFGIPATYTDIDRMFDEVRPEVVHITTPAHTHAPLAKKLLNAGGHVYVEKPFTIDVAEADDVLYQAGLSGRAVCVGHDQLFDPSWLRCTEMVQHNCIGQVQHVESILGYPISGQFGKLVAGDPSHWVRRLPGGLFQNTISHPLYRITEFLKDSRPHLTGGWYRRPEFDFPTELNVTLIGSEVSGTLTFSTRIVPQRITRIYGTTGWLEVDLDAQIVRCHERPRLPGPFAKLDVAAAQWCCATRSFVSNLWRFAKADLHYFEGMRRLFAAFYRSIRDGTDPPIPYSEQRRVTALMDEIFNHCKRQQRSAPFPPAPQSQGEHAVCH